MPQRAPRIWCGAMLMFSAPPASTKSAWPSRISCAPSRIAWSPEPQRRFTVSAGAFCSSPAFRPMCRAKYTASPLVWRTLPKMTWSTLAGSTFERASAPFAATTPRSVAEMSRSAPPNVPNAVRAPSTITTSFMCPPGRGWRSRRSPRPSLSHRCVPCPRPPRRAPFRSRMPPGSPCPRPSRRRPRRDARASSDRADSADRARDTFARMPRRRPVDGLEHREPPRVDVRARRGAEAAGEAGTEVGEDVAEEVRGDDHVEALGMQHEPHRGRVDVHGVALDVGIGGAELLEDVAPELLHLDRVRLVDQGELPPASPRELEGEPDDPLGLAPREAHLDRDALVGRALARRAALRPVHVLDVLAHDDQVDLARGAPLQRAEAVVVERHRTHVRVEVEAAAKTVDDDVALEQPPRDVRVAERAEENCVEATQLRELRLAEGLARAKPVLSGPGERGAFRREP